MGAHARKLDTLSCVWCVLSKSLVSRRFFDSTCQQPSAIHTTAAFRLLVARAQRARP